MTSEIAAAEFSRTLKFRSDQTIVTPITIMLTFDKPSNVTGLFQVAWRVLHFGGPNQGASVTYKHDLMFASVQVDEENQVTAGANVGLSPGQRTTLVKSGPGVIFTAPTTGNQGQLSSTNLTGNVRGLSIGFFDAKTNPNALWVWPSVGQNGSVDAVFTPNISGYITSEYQETQVITKQLVTPVLISQNLSLLPDTQSYVVSRNPDGSYSVTPQGL